MSINAAMQRTAVIALLIAFSVFAAGCSKASNSPPPSGDGQVEASSSIPVEQTQPETSAASSGPHETSISLPGLPVGGAPAPSDDGKGQCAAVAWSGSPAIPSGYSVAVDKVSVAPASAFTVSDAPCAGQQLCSNPAFRFTSAGGTCAVGALWTGQPAPDGGKLSISGTLTCPAGEEANCAAWVADVAKQGQSQVGLDGPPADSPSPSST